MKNIDLLAEKFEQLIREYDDQDQIDEKEYRKLGKLFSSIVRTSPEIREMFFEQVRELSKKMRKNFEQLNTPDPEVSNLVNQVLEKDKILN